MATRGRSKRTHIVQEELLDRRMPLAQEQDCTTSCGGKHNHHPGPKYGQKEVVEMNNILHLCNLEPLGQRVCATVRYSVRKFTWPLLTLTPGKTLTLSKMAIRTHSITYITPAKEASMS